VSQVLRGPSRLNPDYYHLKLADAVWGGGFMTRLNLNLREDKGYTYGAFSALSLLSKAGYWFSSASVQTDKTGETVSEFVRELNDLAGSRPISEQELAEAKANRIRGFAQQFESLHRIGSIVADLWSYGLPTTELQREQNGLEAATTSQVNSVVRKYAVPSESMFVLVGDLSKIEAPVGAVGFGEIVVLDDEGNRIR
ncbi:MAG TPA: insulinase family protein, partial [Bacteroidota bacterium]|nr:insulinase family protein [Bacteroidota bacterium]